MSTGHSPKTFKDLKSENGNEKMGVHELLKAQIEEKRLLELKAKLKDKDLYQMNMIKSKQIINLKFRSK